MIGTTKFTDPAYHETLLEPLFEAAKDDYTPGARVASVVLMRQGAGASADCTASDCCQTTVREAGFSCPRFGATQGAAETPGDMMIFKKLTALVAAMLLGLAAPGLAQDQAGINLDDMATGEPGGVAQFDMALGLYRLGLAQKDALLVLTAAKLAAAVQMTDVVREGAKPAEGGPVDIAAMLASAREFAAEDESILGLIEDVERGRERFGGASRQVNNVEAGAAEAWKIPFFGGSLAEIGVAGDGAAPLDVAITDENGNRVACPLRLGDRFYCAFVPRWNGYFDVTVTNSGTAGNSYYLLTN